MDCYYFVYAASWGIGTYHKNELTLQLIHQEDFTYGFLTTTTTNTLLDSIYLLHIRQFGKTV
jgi:hypothetical protein